MKSNLLTLSALGVILATGAANAATCPIPSCPAASADSTCSASICESCKGTTSTTNSYGVITTTTKLWTISGSCPSSGTFSCYCQETSTYKCAAGYYGSPTSSSSSCTKCPDGKTSSPGATMASQCTDEGNLGDTISCIGCPTQSLSWTAAADGYQARCVISTCEVRCASGYYGSASINTKNSTMSGCNLCPTSGGVAGNSAAGSTSITGCYIPSGTSFTDGTGTFSYTSNCYWSE